MAWPIFGALASVAVPTTGQGRGQSYSSDELVWLSQSPHLDLGGALDPYNGHLLLVTRLVYKAILETFGAGDLPFRLLTLASVVLMAALFFAYVSRRIGAAAALAPTAVLLLFGSHSGHLITGNGFTVLFSLSCGLGALLMLDRGDRALALTIAWMRSAMTRSAFGISAIFASTSRSPSASSAPRRAAAFCSLARSRIADFSSSENVVLFVAVLLGALVAMWVQPLRDLIWLT